MLVKLIGVKTHYVWTRQDIEKESVIKVKDGRKLPQWSLDHFLGKSKCFAYIWLVKCQKHKSEEGIEGTVDASSTWSRVGKNQPRNRWKLFHFLVNWSYFYWINQLRHLTNVQSYESIAYCMRDWRGWPLRHIVELHLHMDKLYPWRVNLTFAFQ